jgi:hypothetical protein
MQVRSQNTTFVGGCHSWYITEDGRNTNNWVGLMREYRQRTADPVMAHYRVWPATSGAAPAMAA